MTTIDSAGLEQVLSSIELRVSASRRTRLSPGAVVALPSHTLTLVYVSRGSVRSTPVPISGCRVDAVRRGHAVLVEPPRPIVLAAGDVFLTRGGDGVALEAQEHAELMLAELEFSDDGSRAERTLPEHISVTDFARHEPAAAALAASMGEDDAGRGALRSGDPLICRMMATTVLLSVIRAWAENGCAPHGWPALSRDPFLDRVVEAIHAEPGREWTVEHLAEIGAMSRTVFTERFRRTLGRSPANYVTTVRIDRAKNMLQAGRAVSEISRELGYASDEGFSRAFRRVTGMTPSTWRASAGQVAVPA